METRVDPIERDSDEVHRRVAEQVRRNSAVIAAAAETLRRWIAREGAEPHPVLLEWKAVLEMLTPSELAEFLVSRTPRAQRLRASSPFYAIGARDSARP